MKQFNDSTIAGNALNTAQQHPDKAYLHSRYDKQGKRTDQVHTYTWSEANRVMRDVCLGLHSMGFKDFDRSAVYAPNRPRWLFAALAPIFLRGAFVPIYPTSKTEDVWWILYDSGSRFCFCGSQEHVDRVLEVKEKLPDLEKIFLMDPVISKPHPMVTTMNELIELGKKNRGQDAVVEDASEKIQEEELAIIMYTSGTTGKPKGVMLTHKNITSQRVLTGEFGFRNDDVLLAHLPFCHSYGFSADLMGGSYVPMELAILDSLQTEEVRWGLQTFHPNCMNSVPRLWEKLYIQINQILAQRPPFLQKYFKWGIEAGSKAYRLELEKKSVPLSVRLQQALTKPLFNLIRKKAGLDRLRLCSTGGGPINPELIVFFGAMGIKLFQGFGLTETAPIINASTPKDNKLGSCGRPLPGVIEKIAEDGEILVKGPQVMKGYWKNDQANKEVFTADGFFLTGDIGYIDEDGHLHITDRKKELFKTSAGKYVAPQPLEYAFNTNPYVEQVAAVGDNRKYICALIVPEFNALINWAQSQGIAFKDNAELVRHEKVVLFMQEQVDSVNKGLARYEQIKKFALLGTAFSEEGGELTPSQKKKRRVIEKKYKHLIDAMYPPGDSM